VVEAKDMQQPSDDLGAVFSRLQQSLRSYLRGRIPDITEAEDLLQEIFVKTLVSERKGHRIKNITGWLYAAARTAVFDYYRATGKPMQELDENIPEREVEDLRLHQEISSCLKKFIEELPPIYRETLIATDLQNETVKSFAEKQSVSVSAIKSRVVRARAMLRKKLLECCQVEMVDGLVSDYSRTSLSRCGGKCV